MLKERRGLIFTVGTMLVAMLLSMVVFNNNPRIMIDVIGIIVCIGWLVTMQIERLKV